MKKNIIAISIIVVCVVISGIFLFSDNNKENSENSTASNISIVDGKQIITINAKGGYLPRVTAAKAGIPTVINMKTQGTFDCSSSLTIPTLNWRNNLPPSGETLIDVPAQNPGATLQGICSMGMYNFSINFN
ncbi:MAG: hypothetical protein A3D44_03960 [Candidatus Staskawiczbacteria bacterium RIFCSPHIGHO2_02_FULL_42_22]|uniref:EfeO-type cupredoxin-like domain-containing protein n=1 Tax=Candidatus Staskawiczbacteria bacterium RIFCSPHIGHO2_02_FULL_42_22 TaxID=1802207 RepID=A0A1G2I1G4_9BACT|nr:MAG: hypothetical protein A3D44_03960 [Candidatus Staskawiczbacteria bacterium RIFCSPHIGHO2_02_FULL_42_22]